MKIQFNHKHIECDEGTTLFALLQSQDLTLSGSVFVVNGNIVAKSQWREVTLKQGDKIDLFNVVAGG
ncbi:MULTISPECIES: sulfur carrier protein ThiS [unclassified Vibrio]|uniref:Sulfur carrier protein ThiS n=1 Tax=Vibrio sp. HB236076 TaxID=3232307 RepID=A0AB39HEE7_9VIBR|nr:sulfur carrier protein ThiS [Vibrio sp. HB161653]MDP5255826.1 sulfur carrier protein ThiS [Vibrio sp. HB161653]